MSHSEHNPSRYRRAGVDLDAARETVDRLEALVERTRTPGVLDGIGGFGGLFGLRDAGILSADHADPILVAGADGVGTKLAVAFAMDRHDTVGIDCVAMCVNDVVAAGARPLFFLDYLATGQLRAAQVEAVVDGIARGCQASGCALLGGETAEMPGFYDPGHYELAGFCVGSVERSDRVVPAAVSAGDVVVGIASSGVHSNGFSLIRRVIADRDLDLAATYGDHGLQRPLGEVLLEPTRIYAGLVGRLADIDIHGLAHITGGGLVENLPRALPADLGAAVDPGSWDCPPIFDFIQTFGEVSIPEMYRVFNMGIGLAVIVEPAQVDRVVAAAQSCQFDAWPVGRITDTPGIDIELPAVSDAGL